MTNIIIGSRILDVLTTGMYPDALDSIREYIQNSFDAIRKAEYAGILKPNFGEVEIAIDAEERVVTIRDNGIGVPQAEAGTTLLSIGASKKKIGDDAGFRGIGRLAGLAYCEKLVFITASNNEPCETELTFDAAEIRASISPVSSGDEVETAAELLTRLTKLRKKDRKPGPPFFAVKLIGVNQRQFLDVDEMRTYLRQVAPVEFNMQAFVYGNSKINPFLDAHSARKTINLKVEYNSRQERINKPYKTFHEAGNRTNNRVEIVDIETFIDPSPSRRWIAWLNKPRHLTGTINAEDVRGIRLRANNIQIGDHVTFSRIFEKIRKTHSRFNGWFSGEVHILDPGIIPNSRRDFFEDNEAWREAERTLVEWSKELAKRAYQNSSDRNRPLELIEDDADEFIVGFEKETAQGFTSESEREQALQDITDREQQIDKAISPNRTDEENEALRRKREEIARLRQEAARPKSLIDESELNRHERRVLRFVMNIVYKICGAESAKLVAGEINKKLKEKARKRDASAPQGAREDNAQEAAAPVD